MEAVGGCREAAGAGYFYARAKAHNKGCTIWSQIKLEGVKANFAFINDHFYPTLSHFTNNNYKIYQIS